MRCMENVCDAPALPLTEIEDRSSMSSECFPITVLPHMSKIYRDYLAMADSPKDAPVRRWYGSEPFAGKWMLDRQGLGSATRLGSARPICWSSRP